MTKLLTTLVFLSAFSVSAKTTLIQCSPAANNETFSQNYSYTMKVKSFGNIITKTSLKSEVVDNHWIKCQAKDRKVSECGNWLYPHVEGKVKVLGSDFNCEKI